DPTVKGTVTLRIAGITEYMDKVGEETKSDVVQCGGLGWYIIAKPANKDGKRYLACFLYGQSEGTWSAWEVNPAKTVVFSQSLPPPPPRHPKRRRFHNIAQ
ncbi:hypothetical protein AAVH_43016, partial [Aphelenchoides avenae]